MCSVAEQGQREGNVGHPSSPWVHRPSGPVTSDQQMPDAVHMRGTRAGGRQKRYAPIQKNVLLSYKRLVRTILEVGTRQHQPSGQPGQGQDAVVAYIRDKYKEGKRWPRSNVVAIEDALERAAKYRRTMEEHSVQAVTVFGGPPR